MNDIIEKSLYDLNDIICKIDDKDDLFLACDNINVIEEYIDFLQDKLINVLNLNHKDTIKSWFETYLEEQEMEEN